MFSQMKRLCKKLHNLNYCLYLLFISICAGLCSSAYTRRSLRDNEVFEQITKPVGWSVTLNCTDSRVKLNRNVTGQEEQRILWRWKNQVESDWEPLSKNNAVVSRIVTNLSECNNFIVSRIALSNLSVSNTGFYACFVEEEKRPIYQIKLRVDELSLPLFLRCEVNGFLTAMSCFWEEKSLSPITAVYRLFYITIFDDSTSYKKSINIGKVNRNYSSKDCTAIKAQFENGENNEVLCGVDFTINNFEAVPVCYMKLQVTDEYGTRNSSEFMETILNHVKTDPPKILKVVNVKKSSAGLSSIRAFWEPPPTRKSLYLKYMVRYRSTKYKKWQEEKSEKTEVLIENLFANSSYEFQVKAKPSGSKDGFVTGSWSNWGAVATHHTPQKEPVGQLVFFEINATKDKPDSWQWEIFAKWSPYQRFDEQRVYYEISFQVAGESHIERYERNVGSFTVIGRKSVNVAGRFCNPIGCSPYGPRKQIHLNNYIQPPLTKVNLSYTNRSKVSVSWKVSGNSNKSMCIVRLCSIYRNPKTFESIFGKQRSLVIEQVQKKVNHLHLCQEVVVRCSLRKTEIKTGLSQCFDYQATVLRFFKENIMKIMISSYPAEVTLENKVASSNLSFKAFPMNSSKKFQIKITLKQPVFIDPKIEDRNLRLSAVFSPKSGAECGLEENCKTKAAFYEPFANKSKEHSELLIESNVYGSTLYDVGLGYCCKSFVGQPQGICFAASRPTVLVRTPSGAPSAPTKLWVKLYDELEIYWSSPRHPNGRISGYCLKFGQVLHSATNNRTREKVISEWLRSGNETSMNIPLHCEERNKNTLYFVRLAAFTDKNDTGPSTYIQKKVCINGKPHLRLRNIYIITVVCFVLFVAIWALVMYYRKYIKRYIRLHIWPEVPTPDVYVQFNSSRPVDESAANDSAEQCDKNTTRIATCDGTVPEIPDSISNEETRKIMQKRIDQEKKKEETISEAASSSSSSLHVAETLQEPSTSYVTDHSASENSTWRRLFYPSLSNHSSTTLNRPRSRSYAGTSANSFDRASYLQQCHELTRQRAERSNVNESVETESSSDIVYNRLILNSNGEPKFLKISSDEAYTLLPDERVFERNASRNRVPDAINDYATSIEEVLQSNSRSRERRWKRGESWYDRNLVFIPHQSIPSNNQIFSSHTPKLFPSSNLDDSLSSHFLGLDSEDHVPVEKLPESSEKSSVDACTCSNDYFGKETRPKTVCPTLHVYSRTFDTSNRGQLNSDNGSSADNGNQNGHIDGKISPWLCEESESYVTINQALRPSADLDQASNLDDQDRRHESVNTALMNGFNSGNSSNSSISMTGFLSRLFSDPEASSTTNSVDRNSGSFLEYNDPNDIAYVTEAETTNLLD